jgi:hypothetical protein
VAAQGNLRRQRRRFITVLRRTLELCGIALSVVCTLSISYPAALRNGMICKKQQGGGSFFTDHNLHRFSHTFHSLTKPISQLAGIL